MRSSCKTAWRRSVWASNWDSRREAWILLFVRFLIRTHCSRLSRLTPLGSASMLNLGLSWSLKRRKKIQRLIFLPRACFLVFCIFLLYSVRTFSVVSVIILFDGVAYFTFLYSIVILLVLFRIFFLLLERLSFFSVFKLYSFAPYWDFPPAYFPPVRPLYFVIRCFSLFIGPLRLIWAGLSFLLLMSNVFLVSVSIHKTTSFNR